MEILLIGNGFDLEHQLPTTYSQFLDFCRMVEYIFESTASSYPAFKDRLQTYQANESIKKPMLAALRRRTFHDAAKAPEDDLFDELHDCLEDNLWLVHFRRVRSSIGKNWIDFESEISRVIQVLDAARLVLLDKQSIKSLDLDAKMLLGFLYQKAKMYDGESDTTTDSLDQLTQRLSADLDRLIRAFEIYIAGFINRIPIESKSPDIENIHPDRLLSFNYSDTFQRVYGPDRKINYDYIHGKADIGSSVETCNLVLGIDEYLDDTRKDVDLQFLTFKKYYQRIYKGTDSTYLDWIREIRKGNEQYERNVESARQNELHPLQDTTAQHMRSASLKAKIRSHSRHTLYVFGHSLDVTDKDILRALICNDHVKTVIYYHRKTESDKTALGQLIHNLVKIIGQEELIRRTGGSKRSIEFVPQTIRDTDSAPAGAAPAAPSGELAALP